MGWMQTTCREAARLMSARRDEPPGPWQGLALKLHLRICGDCREVDRQLEQVDRLTAELFENRLENPASRHGSGSAGPSADGPLGG